MFELKIVSATGKGDKDVKKGFKKTTPVPLDFFEKYVVIKRAQIPKPTQKKTFSKIILCSKSCLAIFKRLKVC
jgi:hypothetical protein